MKRFLFALPMVLLFLPSESQKEETRKIITSMNELYYNSNNVLDVQVNQQSEGNEYRYEVEGAEVSQGKNKNQLLLSPVNESVILKVYQGDKLVGQKNLVATKKPKPVISVYADGGKLDLNGTAGRSMRELKLVADYGEGMKKCISGNFKVKQWSAVVLKANKAMDERRIVETEVMDIADWKKELKSGDRILIEVRKVVQVKSSGAEEEVNMGSTILSVILE